MDFKIKNKMGGTDKVLKNMQKITGTSNGDGIEDGIETGMGELDVSEYLGKLQSESKSVAKGIVDKLNKSKNTVKRLNKKMEVKEGKTLFRKKQRK